MMLTINSLRGARRVLTNLLECQLNDIFCRAITTTRPCLKYRYVPTLNDPEKDIEYSEPGCAHEDEESLIVIPTRKQFKEQVKFLKDEFKVWTQEMKDGLHSNYDLVLPNDQILKIYSFREEGTLEQWSTLCDADEGIGFSSCSLKRSPNGCALFSGNLSTKLPEDGKTVRSGFCSAVGPRALKSFKRKTRYEWSQYTHVVLKVRGDGRQYLVNISTEGEYDLNWHNMYSYQLHTRGGPYWQLTKLPFSKFIFSNRSYIQDTQVPIPLGDVAWIGIALTDDIDGPFNLEIDYIGLENATWHTEEHAYETYNFDNYFYKE